MSQQTRRLYEFGSFQIDTVNRLLLRDGKPISLKPKVVDTLLVLIENRGRVLEKDELIEKLWPDSIVEEGNLTQNNLRSAEGARHGLGLRVLHRNPSAPRLSVCG